MTTQPIKALVNHGVPLDSEVCIQGWIRSRRDSNGGFSFLEINDGTCFASIQAIADASLNNYQSEILTLSAGCSVRVTGVLKASQGKNQSVEIQASRVEVVGQVEDPESYPIAKKRHTYEFLRTVAHLRVRTNTFGAVSRIRHHCAQAIHQFFHQRDFYWVNTPIITTNDCEGAGELFKLSDEDFFAQPAFLTVSGQLNVETHCQALSRVYTFGPTFRAENSNTSRHLAEFWMVEPEVAFADLNDIAQLAESFLKAVFAHILNECGDDMAFFNQRVNDQVIARLEQVIKMPFTRLEYGEAIEALKKSGKQFEFPVRWGLDLQSEHERYLAQEYVKGPVIVANYPQDIKAFYMRQNDDGKTCAAMDVLAPGIGEIIGGSQREERLDRLDKKLAEKGLQEQLWWYRDLRRYGTVPHAGFGLGFERLLNYITGLENIRDVIPFPRTPGSAPF